MLLPLSVGCKTRMVWNTEEEYYRLPRWQQYVHRFEKMNHAPHTTTLFIGDSMTEGFDLKRHFKKDLLINMGISGDFTSGVLRRLYQVERLQPKKIFVMIGINDIGHDVEQPRIESNYAQIIEQLKTLCPGSEIYIQSCLPTHLRSSDAAADAAHLARIVQLNAFIEEQCVLHQVQYIHLYPLFQGADGYLNPDFTYDGLHLNEAGYRIWADAIRQWV